MRVLILLFLISYAMFPSSVVSTRTQTDEVLVVTHVTRCGL